VQYVLDRGPLNAVIELRQPLAVRSEHRLWLVALLLCLLLSLPRLLPGYVVIRALYRAVDDLLIPLL
jgi:hypothetical protein